MSLIAHALWPALTALASVLIYRAFLHPLRQVPGPFSCRLTSLWLHYRSYVGDECSQIDSLHQVYGPVVRIGPNEVVVSDGAALAPIYSDKGGFLKAQCYSNFDSGGHATIFSTLDPNYRAARSKLVLPLFSMNSIRNGSDTIEGYIKKFTSQLSQAADQCRASKSKSAQPVSCNVLNLSRQLALDTVTSYLFGSSYGALDEDERTLSASPFVDTLVALGRFFFLPPWAVSVLEGLRQKLWPDQPENSSTATVHRYMEKLVAGCGPDNSTFQGRLATSKITSDEIIVQCEDLVFAGTDSTGMNLATLCWHLAQNPRIYDKLCSEVKEADRISSHYNPQSLPYLDAVVREGLRIAMANPTRLPRIVPPGGFTFTSYDGRSHHFPAGTQIGSQIFSLHFDRSVFPDPFKFKPERWLEDPSLEMQRNFFAFGLGQRACIARSLATQELLLTVRAVAREGVLKGARAVGDGIEILEWFNSRVKGGRIDIAWG